ncbi:hypothetical protein LP420_13830 [Massilia sp. B-10]|nr:hypothetical protein LP420_13830 [Massilia sp. B-10]
MPKRGRRGRESTGVPQAVGGARASVGGAYLQVGSGSERFLVKEIDSRPDFDHIVAISTRADAPLDAVVLPKSALVQPKAQALSDALPGSKVRGTVYFYTDDLK